MNILVFPVEKGQGSVLFPSYIIYKMNFKTLQGAVSKLWRTCLGTKREIPLGFTNYIQLFNDVWYCLQGLYQDTQSYIQSQNIFLQLHYNRHLITLLNNLLHLLEILPRKQVKSRLNYANSVYRYNCRISSASSHQLVTIELIWLPISHSFFLLVTILFGIGLIKDFFCCQVVYLQVYITRTNYSGNNTVFLSALAILLFWKEGFAFVHVLFQ